MSRYTLKAIAIDKITLKAKCAQVTLEIDATLDEVAVRAKLEQAVALMQRALHAPRVQQPGIKSPLIPVKGARAPRRQRDAHAPRKWTLDEIDEQIQAMDRGI